MAIHWEAQTLPNSADNTGAWLVAMNNVGTVFLAHDVYSETSENTWLKRNGTWTDISVPYTGEDFIALAIDGTGETIIMGGYTKCIISHDYGGTWSDITASMDTDDEFPSFQDACISTDGQYILISAWNCTPRFSRNGGSAWEKITEDPGWPLDFTYYAGMSPSGQTMIVVGAALYITRDWGASWDVAAIPPDGNWPWFGWSNPVISDEYSTIYLLGGWGYMLNVSDDYAQSWAPVTNIPFDHDSSWISLTGSKTTYDLLGAAIDSEAKVYVSNNRGLGWKDEGPVENTASCDRLIINEDGTQMILGTWYGYVYIGSVGHIKSISGALLGDINKVSRVLIEDLGEISDTYK